MIAPFSLPKLPARFYFRFGTPIRTSPEDLKDRTRCDDIYARARDDLQGGIDWLLEQRQNDPYKNLGPRLFYEATWGGKQAPTFLLPSTPIPGWTPLPPRKTTTAEGRADTHSAAAVGPDHHSQGTSSPHFEASQPAFSNGDISAETTAVDGRLPQQWLMPAHPMDKLCLWWIKPCHC